MLLVTRVTIWSGLSLYGAIWLEPMFCEELPEVVCVAEGPCASGPRGRERTRQIARSEARLQISAPHVLIQKARIEAVSRSYCVHGVYSECRAGQALRSALCHRSLTAEFYYHQRHHRGKLLYGGFEVADSGRFWRFALIRQKDVDIAQRVLQPPPPGIVWIVVSVECGG